MGFKILIVGLLGSLLFSCTNSNEKLTESKLKDVKLNYAKRFKVKTDGNLIVLELLGNKANMNVTSSFVLYKNEKPSVKSNSYAIQIPVKKIACMSSIYAAMLTKLHSQNAIAAIDNVDYYTNTFIRNGVKENGIAELAKGINIETEKALALNPDLIITFGMGNPQEDCDKKLVQAGLPIAISLDHLEETPLARAEWIKFFSYFVGKEKMADSLFSITEKNYLELSSLTKNILQKKSVLTEIKYGDAWYIPGGESFIANLLKDAGANYFLGEPNKTGSVPQSFEYVFNKAQKRNVWLNLYNLNSKQELLSYDKRYALFDAYKTGELYNNNKNQNEKGYSDYWETGIVNPDEVLGDIIFILYPNLLKDHELKYYKKLE